MIRRMVFGCALLMCGHQAALAQVPIGQRVQAMLVHSDVVCGHFTQTKTLVGMRKPWVSRGRMCAVKDKGVLWRTMAPFASTLRVTPTAIVQMQGGEIIQTLDATHEPAVKMINQVLFALLRGEVGQLEQVFALQGTMHGATWQVILTPRDAGVAKALRRVALAGDAHVKQITLDEAGGDATRIVMSQVVTGTAAMQPEEVAAFE